MGKVMINESNATKTARNGSSGNSPKGSDKQARAHVDVSRKSGQSGNVGVKVNKKHETKVKINDGAPKSARNADSSRREQRDFPDVNQKNIKKSDKISKFAKPEVKTEKAAKKTTEVAIIEKSIPVNAQSKSNKPAQKANTEMGLVVRGRDIDPEIALMESRARSMERPKPEVLNNARSNGRSMSGMLNTNRRNPHLMSTKATSASAREDAKPAEEPAEEESRFSKMKSMLIGVGVALVVAVVGFAGIAMFGNNKPMCTVHFESNGGSEVEDTEIICGRAVMRPEDPEKEGFTFEGWILDGDPFDFDTTGIYRNSTLVAKWKANDGTEIVKVKFDTDGGSEIREIEIAKGKKVSRPNAPTRWNYIFDNWYLGDKVYDFDEPVNENITLKAKWIKNENNETVQSNRVTSMSVSSNSLTLEKDQIITIAVKVLPSAADYSLAATSSDEKIVACSVDKTDVTCTAKAAGKAKITVRDVNSGNTAEFTITVPDQTPPEIVEPEPEKPDPNPTPDPDPEPTPTPTPTPTPDPNPDPTPEPHDHIYVDGKCTICGDLETNPGEDNEG